MALLVCGSDCAAPSWDFIQQQLTIAVLLWLLLLLAGFGLVLYSATSDVDALQAKLDLQRRKLHASVPFVLVHMTFAILQSGFACMRTLTKSADDFSFLIEACASIIYLVDFALCWTGSHLTHWSTGLSFMCTWAVTDCLLIPSVLSMPVSVNSEKSWGSLSFLAALHLLQSWEWLFFSLKLNLQVLRWRLASLVGSAAILVFFAALAMLTIENLGDPDVLDDLQSSPWNSVAAIYFVFTSVTTVGAGDLVASTALGRLFALGTVIGGTLVLGLSMQQVARAVVEQRSGGGSFQPGVRTKHIIVSGNPTAAVIKDFIAELFHPDHSEDAEDLHAIFFFPRDGEVMQETMRFMRQKGNIGIAAKVSLIKGSVLDCNDLLRVSALKAVAFFVLPNTLCESPLKEDAENIIRMIALRRYIPSARVILLLIKAESRYILEDAGINVDVSDKQTIIAVDQLKLELIGKSIDALGFAPFICNLCKSVGEDDEVEGDKPIWRRDYERGLANELYEIELSALYSDKRSANFVEVVLDVLEQTGGYVYLIGVVEVAARDGRKLILVNPGPDYPIKPTTSGVRTFGIFIAPDRESVVQCEVNMVFLGRRERPVAAGLRRAGTAEDLMQRARLPGMLPESRAEPELLRLLGPDLQPRARLLVGLAETHRQGLQPLRPPIKVLAAGGHVLFLCIGARNMKHLRLGLNHFVRPLRVGKGKMMPIVVLSPEVPRDWETVCDQPAVYFFRGSPLSESDLERANFRAATAIFICNVADGTISEAAKPQEGWMVDSEAICCARLVESKLPIGARTLVVADIKSDSNHQFLPVPATSNIGSQREHRVEKTSTFLDDSEAEGGASTKRVSPSLSLGSGGSAELPGRASSRGQQGQAKANSEYFRQPRFASGQLFVGSIVTSLVVNTFYNPSLSALVSSMMESDIYPVPVPPFWVGKSYFEYFDHLLYTDQRLPVGILRRADPSRLGAGGAETKNTPGLEEEAESEHSDDKSTSKRRFAFVMTAPPAKETTMLESDQVICFGKSNLLRNAAAH